MEVIGAKLFPLYFLGLPLYNWTVWTEEKELEWD